MGGQSIAGSGEFPERVDKLDEDLCLEEDKAAVAVVVGEAAEPLVPDRYLRVLLVGQGRVECHRQYTPHMPSIEISSMRSSSVRSVLSPVLSRVFSFMLSVVPAVNQISRSLRLKQPQIVGEHVGRNAVEMMALHRLALVQRDRFAVFPHPNHVVAEVRLEALLLEVERICGRPM